MVKNNNRWVLWSLCAILLAAAILAAVSAVDNQNKYKSLGNTISANNQENFYNLSESTELIENDLSRLIVSADKENEMALLAKIYHNAGIAGMMVSSLPIDDYARIQIAKFYNQVSDYCFSLMNSISQTRPLSIEEADNIALLQAESAKLNEKYREMVDQVNQGNLEWWSININETEPVAKIETIDMENLQISYPKLIYDGPFSDMDTKNAQLSGKLAEFDEAAKNAVNFIGYDRVESYEQGPQRSGFVEMYGVQLNMKNGSVLYCGVSKQGGMVVDITQISENTNENTTIDKKQAEEAGKQFLGKNGLENMETSFSMKDGNMLVVSYISKQDGILIYPDLIKLRISLVDGLVYGYESKNYIANNKVRDINPPEISAEEAVQYLNTMIELESARMAIIPKEKDREVMCYEFIGTYQGDRFIIYINANTGEEEDIFKLIDTEDGTLVI